MATILPFRVMNFFMSGVLRSPLHGMVSKSILLITLKGRKSGKSISTPVSFTRTGDKVIIFSHGAWVKNLEGGASVTLRIQGKDVTGYATLTHDSKAKTEALSRHLTTLPGDAKYYQVKIEDGKPNRAQVQAAAGKSTLIRVKVK
jgi:deazaflavin-dependent oxidoreductase (nitroreductase family)